MGFFQPTFVENRALARVESLLLGDDRSSFIVVVHIIGSQALSKAVSMFIYSSWRIHSPFKISIFEDSYKVYFIAKYDYERALYVEWTWIDFRILLVLPQTIGMQLPEDVLETILVWVTIPCLNHKFWNDEIVARIASTLGTPLSGHLTYNSSQEDDNFVT